MRAPKMEYERVPVGVPVLGIIEVVQYDENRTFKAYNKGDDDTVCPAVRFKFKLESCNYPHYTRWGRFNVGEKSNLYKKYLSVLIEDAVPDMDIDLDVLNGMAVKTVWSNNGDFQNLDSVEAAEGKIKQEALIPTENLDEPENQNDEPPIAEEEPGF